jgi:hypothetical protein
VTDELVFTIVVVGRLGLPLLIARYPIPAILSCLVLDAADQSIFQKFTSLNLDSYQTYDKALDIYYLTLAYLSTIRNWAGGPDFVVGRALWYYRLVGVALFEYTSTRWLLLVFPNTFEYYFIAIELYKLRRDPNKLSMRNVCYVAGFIWIFIKLPQEWWIHVAQLDFTDFAKEDVFGVDADSTWWAAIGNRPLLALAIVLAAAALAWVLTRACRRLPPARWPTTFDADRQGEHLGWRPPRKLARPEAFFNWTFVEKVALISLVAFIFARILPGADARLTTSVAITAYLIAINTLLSQWLAGRGTTWRNTGVQFLAMATVNLVVVVSTVAVFGGGPESTPLGTTLFLVGVLTLIVVLYDRSHGFYADLQRQRLAAHPTPGSRTASA